MKPRSATQMTRERVQALMSPRTWRIRSVSPVLPGQDHTRTGMPSRVTAIPTTTWGRSSRESLDLPWVRNPASLTASSLSSAASRPPESRGTGSSASPVSK